MNKHLLKAIEDSMYFVGTSIELSNNIKDDYFRLDEEIEKGNICAYINMNTMNSNMFLYTFVEMLKNNEITILFNDNATKQDKDYLENLSKYF